MRPAVSQAPPRGDGLAVGDYLTDGDVLVEVLELRQFIAVVENVCDGQTLRIPRSQLRQTWRRVTPAADPTPTGAP